MYMSYLQHIKAGDKTAEQKHRSHESKSSHDRVLPLSVDVYQTADLIIVYAQAAGAELSDIHVSVEGNANVVLIEGKGVRPEYLAFPEKKPAGRFFTEECVWGDFSRHIVLPESIAIERAEAKIRNGVLVLILPLLNPDEEDGIQLVVHKAPAKGNL